MNLLIAIPALNEEESIRGIVQRSLEARQYIIENSPVTDVEITVVSDGSTDATVERAMEFSGRIKVIVFPKNRGYGAAIMEAWAQSDADLLGFLDADGTCDPRIFAPLCRKLADEKADIVLGCRMAEANPMPPIRRLGNRIFALLLASLSNKMVKDTASGMRVVRRSALPSLYPLPSGLHFTPAMSARAMLSDHMRIVEVDMPYAEREGRSKLSVLRDGFRFLKVILSTALLYRPGKLLMLGSGIFLLMGALLMITPVVHYLATRTVAEWMIYRFLVSTLFAQVSLLLWGASGVTSRIVGVAIQREVRNTPGFFYGWVRTPWFWVVTGLLTGAGAALVYPAAHQLWQTGHTNVHWSRFVVATTCFGFVATLGIFLAIDHLLDLVDARVRYLTELDKGRSVRSEPGVRSEAQSAS
jgi:glycosyltransferase involved in cell wall biosynthesis